MTLSGSVLAVSAATLLFLASWFYGYFGVAPEEVGLGPTSSRVQAIIGITLLWVGGVALALWVVTTGWIRVGQSARPRPALTHRQRRIRALVVTWGMVGATIFQILALSVLVVQGAEDVRAGEPIGGWLHRTPRVTVIFVDDASRETTSSLRGCLMYLGHADNTTVLFNATDDRTLRLPTSALLITMQLDQRTSTADCED